MKQSNYKREKHRRPAARARRSKRAGRGGSEKIHSAQPPWLRVVSGTLPAPEYLLKTSS
jgi:hypothetical protein